MNTKIIEDYISAIDEYTYDEEAQAIVTSKENAINGRLEIKAISVGGSHNGKQFEEIKQTVKIRDAAKFDRIYKYLQSGDEDIEVLVTARF